MTRTNTRRVFTLTWGSLTSLLFALVCSGLPGAAAGMQLAARPAVTVILTADTQGHVGPCTTCGGDQALGGLTRRKTLIDQIRKGRESLLLDAGNALFGSESLGSEGRVIADSYLGLGYDAVNLSFRDFRLGKEATLRILRDTKLPLVSANLRDAAGGQALAPAYITRKVGATRVAVVGVTEDPRQHAAPVHLEEQLRGITIEDPVEAVARVLPGARAEADHILLLYYGSAETLVALRERFGREIALTLVGGVALESPPKTTGVVGAKSHGRALTVIALAADGTAASLEAPISPEVPQDPELLKVIQRHRPEKSQATSSPSRPQVLGKGVNRGLYIAVTDASVTDKIDGYSAREGHRLVVLQTHLENAIAPDLAYELDYGQSGKIAHLRRQTFLVTAERTLHRMVPHDDSIEGSLPDEIPLTGFGSIRQGRMVFEVPSDASEKMELRFYAQTFAPIVVPFTIAGPAMEQSGVRSEPILPPRRNELMELSIHDWAIADQFGSQAAPDGAKFIVVDVRARSLKVKQTDARALDAEAPANAKVELGLVTEYLKAERLMQLLVDDRYPHTRLPAMGSLEAEPVLLPDLPVGGQAVFLVPDDARSLKLVCQFPEMKLTTGEALGLAKTIEFVLKEEQAAPGDVEPLASVNDRPTILRVFTASLVERFGSIRPKRPEDQLLAVEMSVENTGPEGGLFEIRQRLTVGGAGGEPVAITGRNGTPLGDPIYLAPGATRAFIAVFSVPAQTKRAAIAYRGVSITEEVIAPVGEPPTSNSAVAAMPAPTTRRVTTRRVTPHETRTAKEDTSAVPGRPSRVPQELDTSRATLETGAPLAGTGDASHAKSAEPVPPDRAPRFCTHCGSGLIDGARFCTACGRAIAR